MQVIGILVACTIRLASGDVQTVNGYETNERNTSHEEQILFVPADGSQAQWVNNNNCLYKEDPIKAYHRMIKQRQIKARATHHIDKIIEGDDAWCVVDGYGAAKCLYQTMADCSKRITEKFEYCIEKKNLD